MESKRIIVAVGQPTCFDPGIWILVKVNGSKFLVQLIYLNNLVWRFILIGLD